MKTTHKILFAVLLMPLLLSACQLTPPASPAPEATMPPRDAEHIPWQFLGDPLDIWRGEHVFRDAEVKVPLRAVNFPVLIVEVLDIDRDVHERFALSNAPGGIELHEKEIPHFDDQQYSYYPDEDRYGLHWIESEVYGTPNGNEYIELYRDNAGISYRYSKFFNDLLLQYPEFTEQRWYGSVHATPNPFSLKPGDPIRYSQEEAVELALGALAQLNVPVAELELHFAWPYEASVPWEDRPALYGGFITPYTEHDMYVRETSLPYGGRGYSIRFRHILYDIPVFDNLYFLWRSQLSSGEDSNSDGSVAFYGDYAEAIVSDLGLRRLNVRYHRVIEVEEYDVPILLLRDIVEKHLDRIKTLGRIKTVEMMLVPTYYSAQWGQKRYRLVPAWCFFPLTNPVPSRAMYWSVIIDATDGKLIHPSGLHWKPQSAQ